MEAKKIEKKKRNSKLIKAAFLIFGISVVLTIFYSRAQCTPKKTLTVTQGGVSSLINVKLSEGFSEYTDSYVFKEDPKKIYILVKLEKTDSIYTESLKNLPIEIKGGILCWQFESAGHPLTGWNWRW